MSKMGKAIECLKQVVLCQHHLEFQKWGSHGGQVYRCNHCKCRVVAFPGSAHFDSDRHSPIEEPE